jgi:hypothetical protein
VDIADESVPMNGGRDTAGADASMPADTSLLSVLDGFESDGYTGQFIPLEAGIIRCATGNHQFSAASSAVERSRRLEGVSDPADMMIVLGLVCPICGAAGTLVLHYGPEATIEEADALTALQPT